MIKQTAKASDYVIQPFTANERQILLIACLSDELPMMQFWFATGLRPSELQALESRHIDWNKRTAHIERNQVAGVVKTPKTAAGIKNVALNPGAMNALRLQQPMSSMRGARIWLNPRNAEPWSTDAQIRKTL